MSTIIKNVLKGHEEEETWFYLTRILGFLIESMVALLPSCPLPFNQHFELQTGTQPSGKHKEHADLSLHQKKLLFNG